MTYLKWLLAIIMPCGLLAVAPMEAYETTLREAAQVTYTTRPSMDLYDAIGRLSSEPASTADIAFVRAYATSSYPDAQALAPALDTMAILYSALGNQQECVREELSAFKKKYRQSSFLRVLNFSTAMEVCSVCKGQLVCPKCKGTLKCPVCKGTGKVRAKVDAKRSFSSSLGASEKEPCKACNGTGVCPQCKGVRKVCEACNNTGKQFKSEEIARRLKQVAQETKTLLSERWKDELATRAETESLHQALVKLQSERALPKAEAILVALDYPQAIQWPEVARLKVQLQAAQAYEEEHSAVKENERRQLRSRIQQAQQKTDALAGMAILLPALKQFATCDGLPAAEAALEGLITAATMQRKALIDAQREKLSIIISLQDLTERQRLITETLSDWPTIVVPEEVKQFAKTSARQAVVALTQIADLKKVQQQILEQQVQLEKALEIEENKKAKGAYSWLWWIASGLGGLLLIWCLYLKIASSIAQNAEMKRQRSERERMENIRATFRHKR